ncbi:hypothetical protein D3C80_2008690 [compost metagenome]
MARRDSTQSTSRWAATRLWARALTSGRARWMFANPSTIWTSNKNSSRLPCRRREERKAAPWRINPSAKLPTSKVVTRAPRRWAI